MDTIKDKQRLDALAESGSAPWRIVRRECDSAALMLQLSLSCGDSPVRRVLALGAHADDIEIGCGATLLALTRARPDIEVTWVVLGATRRARARGASERGERSSRARRAPTSSCTASATATSRTSAAR